MYFLIFSGRETCSWWLPQQGEEEGKRIRSSFFSYGGFRLKMLKNSEELFLVPIQTLGGELDFILFLESVALALGKSLSTAIGLEEKEEVC